MPVSPMNRRKAQWVVATALVLAMIAAWSLLRTRETDVYLTFLEPFSVAEGVLISRPSSCGDVGSREDIPDALYWNFIEANGRHAEPISLLALKASFLTVNTRRVDHYAALGIDIEHVLAETPHVFLSRVGFDAKETQALFCIETKDIGGFLHLRKIDGQRQIVAYRNAWDV